MNERLARDHADLGKSLDELCAALEAGDIAGSHERLDLFWARLAVHIRAEHLHLFPAILNALTEDEEAEVGKTSFLPQAQNTIDELRRDHDFFMHELSRAITLLRELLTTSNHGLVETPLEDARARVVAVEKRLVTHNRLEEAGVYLWTGRLLNQSQQSALEERISEELANMPPRFATNAKPRI